MERTRYTSKDDIRHFIEGDINLIELLRNACFEPREDSENIDGDIKKEKYQFNVPIKIIIPDINGDS